MLCQLICALYLLDMRIAELYLLNMFALESTISVPDYKTF
jgi:hypothetical protein